NVTCDNLLGSISIGSGFCSGKAVMENLASSNGLSLVDTEDQLVPDTKGLGYQYQDKSFYKRFHVYPRQNKYDEIKVSVTDSQGNNTTICIPIHVIPQQVHFRSIGQERTIK
ncbi:hypothetical protein MJH12_18890, partial [bacterium]|nr:hypothetical protein [bacterium]